jgi:hypothetical protein
MIDWKLCLWMFAIVAGGIAVVLVIGAILP